MLLAALLAAGSLVDWALLNAVWRGDAAACARRRRLLAAVGENSAPVAVRRDAAGASRPRPGRLRRAAAGGRRRAGRGPAVRTDTRRRRHRRAGAAAGALSGWPWGGEAIGPLRWGGLLVTLILAIAALLAAVPLAVGLALLRRSSGPAGSFAAATLIEAVRGVPLVTQLLFASFVLPMLLGGGVSKFSMALAALTLHTACWPRCCAARCKPSRRARWRRPARWAWAPPWPTRP